MADDELTLALQRFDLNKYLLSRGGTRSGEQHYLLRCPRCGREKLSVSLRARQWRCFICEQYGPARADGRRSAIAGAGGLFRLVQWLEGASPYRAAQIVLEATAAAPGGPSEPLLDEIAGPATGVASKRPTGLPEKCLAPNGNLPYMERRGISLADAQQFGIGYVPAEVGGWLANRLIFPVWERGVCLYWQARAMWDASEHRERWPGDKFRKSLNPSAVRHGVHYYGSSDVLLNLEQAATYPRVAITEGPTSCIRTGPSAVATFGKTLSPAQIARLVAYRVKGVDFMWDGPGPTEPQGAWPQMLAAAAALAPHMDVRLVFLPQGDPGDYRRSDLDAFRAQARPFSGAPPPI